MRVITLYDKLNLEHGKIQSGLSVVFTMDKSTFCQQKRFIRLSTLNHIIRFFVLANSLSHLIIVTKTFFYFTLSACNTFTDCVTCLANRGKRYNCSWCNTIQKCSDGYDRSRHQWVQGQCHYLALENSCPSNVEDPFFDTFIPQIPFVHQDDTTVLPQHSTLSTIRTIIVTLLLTVLILSLIAFIGTYVYAYRHPTSPPGIWLLEHRPTTYIARFKRSSGMNNDSS